MPERAPPTCPAAATRTRELRHRSRLIRLAAVASLLFIAYATLYPFAGWQPPPDDLARRMLSTLTTPIGVTDIVGNTLLYLPAGWLVAHSLAARPGAAALGATVTALALFSVATELAQGLLPARTSSLVDVLTNTAGALAGAAIAVVRPAVAALLPAAWRRVRQPGRLAGAARLTLVLWGLTQLSPFIPSIDVGQIHESLAPLLSGWHETDPRSVAEQILTLGVLACLARLVLSGTMAGGALVVVAAGLSLVAPILVVGRTLDPATVMGTVAGSALGLAIARHAGQAVGAALAAGYLALQWPVIGDGFQTMNLVPFRPHLYAPLQGLTDILGGAWPYAALTTLIAAAIPRHVRLGGIAGVVLSALTALALEVAARHSAAAYPDITDVITATAAAGGVAALLAGPGRVTAHPPSGRRT